MILFINSSHYQIIIKEVAKQLRPNSLRSLFGITKVENAVHCTDLEEDTVLEVEYFFKIL